MEHYKISKPKSDPILGYNTVNAKIPKLYDNIRVIVGSEETIFSDVYMTGSVFNNRLVKFKKEMLVFS